MPTYDYVCDACKHEMELFQNISAEAIKKCPKCKKNKLRRLIGAGAGILFKGSGFYQTDYRSDSYKKAAKADSNGESKPTPDGASKPTSDGASKNSTDSACSGDKSSCKKCSD